MAELLPKILVVAGGLCLWFMLLAFWQSLRGVIAHAGQTSQRTGRASAARVALLRPAAALQWHAGVCAELSRGFAGESRQR